MEMDKKHQNLCPFLKPACLSWSAKGQTENNRWQPPPLNNVKKKRKRRKNCFGSHRFLFKTPNPLSILLFWTVGELLKSSCDQHLQISWVRISTVTSLLCRCIWSPFFCPSVQSHTLFVEIIVENVFQVFCNVFHKLSFNTKLLQYHNFQSSKWQSRLRIHLIMFSSQHLFSRTINMKLLASACIYYVIIWS